jgi:small subunit ribosomal protein S8
VEVLEVTTEDLKCAENVLESWFTRAYFLESERPAGNMSTDKISNMISMLKNASMAKRTSVEFFHTIECEKIAEILKDRGFLKNVKVFKGEKSKAKMLHLDLAEENGVFALTEAKRISKPGRRIYKSYKLLRPGAGRFGIIVVSTPKGIMDNIKARKHKVGGEVLCEVF